MKVFLDANVLISVLNKEYPVFTYSSRVLSLAGDSRFKLFTSPVCLTIAFYFSEKKSGTQMAKTKINMLSQHIALSPISQKDVRLALTNKKVLNFEDGLEYYSATHAGCKCIVSESIADLHFSEIETLNSEQFIQKYL